MTSEPESVIVRFVSDDRLPSISSAFRAGSDPSELREAVTDLGRFADTTRAVHRSHWEKIKQTESNLIQLSVVQEQHARRLDKLEWRMAGYAALGAAGGGILTTVIVSLVTHWITK